MYMLPFNRFLTKKLLNNSLEGSRAFLKARYQKARFLRLSLQEQIMFAKRLAILVKAGIPILQALDMLQKQTTSKSAAHIMRRLSAEVANGQYLSTGMALFSTVFGDFAVNIVRVGEVSGTLHENLHYLAAELKKKQELRRKLVGALIYPLFILVATVGIAILLTAYVFPKIVPIFQSFKAQLPWSTRVLIFVTYSFNTYWLYILIGVSGFAFLLSVLWRIRPVRFWVDRNLLRVPLIGTLLQTYHMANCARTLGLLLKSDVRIIESLRIVSTTMHNLAYKDQFILLAENVGKGGKLSTYLEVEGGLFPAALSQMVSVGEMTGNLSQSLLYVADMYEDELNTLTKNLATSIEPILMICVGVLVGFIAISIITPIYSITQSLHS